MAKLPAPGQPATAELSMSSIRIGADERPLRDADPQWINQSIRARRNDGHDVCVLVSIQASGVSVTLATPGCGGGGGGGRAPNTREAHVLDLWTKLGLSATGWQSGNVVAFLHQVDKYL